MTKQPQPHAFLVGDAPTPFLVIHSFDRIWKVVPANRRGDAKLLLTIRGLERRTKLMFNGGVSTQAITRGIDGFGFPTYEFSGKGGYQLMTLWAQAHGQTGIVPSRIFTERTGVQRAEDWMLGTGAYLARDHSQVFSGTVPDDNPDNPHRHQAKEEWEINRAFWADVFRPVPD